MLQSAVLKFRRLILVFSVPPFNPRVPSRTLGSQHLLIFRLSSISLAGRHERQVGVGSEAAAGCSGLSDDSV